MSTVRCQHTRKRLFDRPRSPALALQLPKRADAYRVCSLCGKVGRAAKDSGRIDHYEHRADLVAAAAQWNERNRTSRPFVATRPTLTPGGRV